MTDLFGHVAEPPKKQAQCDAMSAVGRRKLNLPDNFRFVAWKRVDPDAFIVDMQEAYTKTRGKNAGKTGWRGERFTTYMTHAEILAEQHAWEAETGLCNKCHGTGQEIAGIGVSGTRYRPCRRCAETGNAPPTSPHTPR